MLKIVDTHDVLHQRDVSLLAAGLAIEAGIDAPQEAALLARADVVFAGNPVRAFVSCPAENVVQVIDPETLTVIQTISIEAERPKALAASPDGSKVYAAIFESGNGSTILAPRFCG